MQGVAQNTGGIDISVMTLIVTVEVRLRPESSKQTTKTKVGLRDTMRIFCLLYPCVEILIHITYVLYTWKCNPNL